MRKELLALFSGFPDHHFSEEITKRLREELKQRKSIVFLQRVRMTMLRMMMAAIELGVHLYRKMKEKFGKMPNFNIVNDDFITP